MTDTDKYEKLIESIVICEEEYINGSDNLLEDSQRLKACAIELLAEAKRLRALFEETNQHLDLMVERFGIETLVEMVGEEE